MSEKANLTDEEGMTFVKTLVDWKRDRSCNEQSTTKNNWVAMGNYLNGTVGFNVTGE